MVICAAGSTHFARCNPKADKSREVPLFPNSLESLGVSREIQFRVPLGQRLRYLPFPFSRIARSASRRCCSRRAVVVASLYRNQRNLRRRGSESILLQLFGRKDLT